MLPNIESEKFFAAKVNALLCADFNSYIKNNKLWYKFELTDDYFYENLYSSELFDDYLLFENLGNGKIKEILSGVVLNADLINTFRSDNIKGNEIFEFPRSVEDIQNNKDFEKVLSNPLGIFINVSKFDLDKLANNYLKLEIPELLKTFESDYCFTFKIDDNFKYYYSENILPKKDIVIKTLKSAETIARKIIQGRMEEENNRLHEIALTSGR